MATITTTCPSCRLRARLSTDEIVLRSQRSGKAPATWLTFLCHTCEALASTTVADATRDRLVEAGIAVEHMTRSPERAAIRRPFSLDDLLDLHLLLASPDWFQQLEQLTTPSHRPGRRLGAHPSPPSLPEEDAS